MDTITQQKKYMRQTLRLAARGAGRVAPNPLVGAVIVKDGQVIGKGFHEQFGGPHAEINALANCRRRGHDPRGATVYVSLEPCCHRGKTGPCTEALIAAGVARVETAQVDPCPHVAGGGVAALRARGIIVNVGLCQAEAERLNAGFIKHQRTGLPLVIIKWAQSLDGKLGYGAVTGPAPDHAGPRWITNEKSRRHVHQIRSQCGAVLAGIGTVLADDPLLNVRLRGRGQPLRVVFDSHLRLPLNSRLATSAGDYPLLVVTTAAALAEQGQTASALETQGAEVIALPAAQGCVPLEPALKEIARRGVTELLVEGGPTLQAALLRERWADRALVYIAPFVIGAADAPALPSGPAWRLQPTRIRRFDGDLCVEADISYA